MNGPPRMGPRGHLQQIPPSGPMMRQQSAPPNMPMGGPGDMQRMRYPSNMMGPGGPMNGPNGPQKAPASHPSPQHAGSPVGMWSNMAGSGSPNPNLQMQQQSIGSPRTPGTSKHYDAKNNRLQHWKVTTYLMFAMTYHSVDKFACMYVKYLDITYHNSF